jgi:hypothetical protein
MRYFYVGRNAAHVALRPIFHPLCPECPMENLPEFPASI